MTADHIYTHAARSAQRAGKGPGVGDPGGALCDIMDADVRQRPDGRGRVEDRRGAGGDGREAGGQAAGAPRALRPRPDVNPKADWRQVLRRFVVELRKDDFSLDAPEEDDGAARLLPAHAAQSEGMGEIVKVVDRHLGLDRRQDAATPSAPRSRRSATTVRPRMTRE
jgi:hypothetical protein